MKSFEELINEYKNKDTSKKHNSERAELFTELYKYYELDFKKQTWKSYILWLKQNKLKHTNISLNKYKKIMFKKITVKSFCSYWLGHIKTNDLYYLVSIAKDMSNRNQSFNKWLFYSLKVTNTLLFLFIYNVL